MSPLPHLSPWKKDFGLFEQSESENLSYFDAAATTLVPQSVAHQISHYQQYEHANSHRGFYKLSAKSTQIVEQARALITNFINANTVEEVIFSASTTAAINMVADSYLKHRLTAQQNIVVTLAEHHANFIPWQQLCLQTGAEFRVVNILPSGELDLNELRSSVDENTALVAVTHVSNVLGTKNSISDIAAITKKYDAKLFVDGAQAVAHHPIDVQALGCDFYVFSGHKCYAGTGLGILYATLEVQACMTPSILGGGIVDKVTIEDAIFCQGPQKFEAGSRNVAAIVGLTSAINYLNDIGRETTTKYITELSSHLYEQLSVLPFIELISQSTSIGIVSFNLKQIHSHDVATCLDMENIAVRAGHHCAQPLHQSLGVKSSVRVSLGIYNDRFDVEQLINALAKIHNTLRLD